MNCKFEGFQSYFMEIRLSCFMEHAVSPIGIEQWRGFDCEKWLPLKFHRAFVNEVSSHTIIKKPDMPEAFH